MQPKFSRLRVSRNRRHNFSTSSKFNRIALLLLLAVLFSGTWSAANAQAVSATLLGSVSDKSGASVNSAKVSILELATGISHIANTNESGNYTFPDLPPGAYSVTAEASGFKKETRARVDVIVNTATRVDLSLEPGSASETVTVTDAPPILQTDRADVSTKFEARHIEDMPLSVNRNFQGMLNLVPGTTPATFQHSQFFNAQSSLQTEVNGVPRMGNSYQIEGIDDDERTGLLQIMIPPADAIQTVDISTNNFEAELGRAIGAVTNVTLKSGANAFHGSATEYLQNSVFDARPYFAKSVGHVAYNYFGGNVSGPIIRNKLFFYGDYYRTSDHEANSNTLTIPPTQFYTDNGSGYVDLSAPLKADGTGQIYDPSTGNADGSGRTPFPNNQIPVGRINPVSLNLLHLLPAPNTPSSLASPTNNYFAVLPFQKTADTYDAKIDWQITEKDHLSGRYSYQKVNTFQAPVFGSMGGGPAQGAFQGTGLQNAFSTGLNYDRAFSPTLLTEVRFGVAHYHSDAQPSDYGSDDATAIGIPGVNISPFTSGQVGISLGSFSSPIIGYSASVPWRRGEANIDFVNHWTKIIGNHTIKFGGDLRRIQDNLLQDQTFSPRGVITFAEDQTSILGGKTNLANDMASFLLDVPSQVGRDVNTYSPAYRQWWFFAFAGDKWQASSKLTLDLGVRWEFYPPATPGKSGGFSNYDPTNNTLVIAGVGGNPSNLGMETRYRYFAPRLGFAYRASEQTVVRGGFGISYMPFPDNTYAYNYPVRANNSYQPIGSYTAAVLDDGSIATFQAGFPAPKPIDVPTSGILPAPISQSYIVIPQNYKNPYVESWNLVVQQALPAQFNLQLAYVANHGVDIGTAQNINLPPALNLGTKGEPEYIAFGRSASTTAQFLGYSSNFQSLQAQLTRRFTNGLATSTAFTWGKGLGYQSGDDGGLTFWLDQHRNYAPNDYDRRLNFEESFTYELPFGKGKRWLSSGVTSVALGGWKLSGIISVVSGIPFTMTANGGTINTPGQQQTTNLVKPFHVLHGIGTGNNWFDTSSFTQPAGCTGTPCPIQYGSVLGNTGRNEFYGPGFIQDNISAFKTFPIWESLSLETRVDAFQLSNTPQFANPSNSITSSTFGQVTATTGSGSGVNGTGGGRALQLSGTIRF
ncbi:TonB-dependent receptor [Acidobacterium sp. S8]|uniref:TonB-dependent receptor n=1 Tax=Acidobacterium sp. S8 TaxID=1641854 RepID=UPI00131C152D|nr:carboxypeptidase regulatory-like domain-containing protein [Acidobacterium sp. S8]